MEHGKDCSLLSEQIKKEVIPDLFVYQFWLAKFFDVKKPAENYFRRMVSNMERLYQNKIPVDELNKLKNLLNIK